MFTFITPLHIKGRGVLFSIGLFLFLLFFAGEPSFLEALIDLEAPTYRDQGYQAQQKGQLNLAIEYYQKAIAIDPYYATPHNDLGIVYEEQGKLEKAEQEYLKTLSLDPRFLDTYANLALLYEQMGKRDKAVVFWKKRIDYGDPNDPWTRKAMERLSLLAKEEIVVSYPPSPDHPIPSAPLSFGRPAEGERESEFEEFGTLPTELYYTIGPSDTLEISVWRHSDLSRTVKVRPDGRISFPLVDDLYVSGLTPTQVDAELTKRLSKTLRDPTVTVIMTGFGSKGVYLLGEVRRPGRYPLTQPTTAMELIARAGQWRDSGVLSSVMVVRRGWTDRPKVYRVNLAQVVTKGDTTKDMALQNGDVVFIPRTFVRKLDNFLTFFTKHLFGTTGGFVTGTPVQITEPLVQVNE